MILFAGAVYFVFSLSASLLVSWLKKGLYNDYPEKCFKMVWSLSGADRLLHGSEKKAKWWWSAGLRVPGKSTLIKTVNGLEPIQQGQIIVDGTTVNDKKTNLANCVRASGWYSSTLSCSRIYRLSRTSPWRRSRCSIATKPPPGRKGLSCWNAWGFAHAENSPPSSRAANSSAWPSPALCMDPIAMLFDEPTSALDRR